MRNTKRNFVIITIVALVFLIISAIFIHIYFAAHKQDRGHASIELSMSIDRIYLGGSGEINAILRYSGDGSTAQGNFSYESDRPDLISFEQKEGKYTGEYKIKAKRSDESFNDVNIVVTVSCISNSDIEPSCIQLTVTDAKPLSINFYKNKEDTDPTKTIKIYQGYSIAQINEIQHLSLNIPDDYQPSNDFDTEWYDKDTNTLKLVCINEETVFYGGSDLNLYGRYRLNKALKLVDELNKNSHESQAPLYFGEKIKDETLLEILGKTLDVTDGWTFEGWVPNLNNSDSKGLEDGKFVFSNSTLFAKWTSSINFEVPLAEGTTESLGVPQIENTTVNSISVTYGGNIGKLPSIKYAYPVGLTDDGWYTDKFGTGESLTSFLKDGCYIGFANQTYYNKTEVEIVFHDELTSTDEFHSVVYGAPFPEDESFPRFTKKGWTLETNWDVTGIGEVTENFMRTSDYNLNKTTTCNAIWNITIKYNANIGKIVDVYSDNEEYYTVRYGHTLDLDLPTNQGSWRFAGWYDNVTLSGDTVERQSTSSLEFINFASNHVTQISGKYYLQLYAKWVNEVSLDYGYDNDQNRPSDLPTTLQLVYGKKTLPSISQISGSSGEYIPNGYAGGIGWYADKNKEGDKINADTSYYPLSMSGVLYFKWEAKTYKIILKYIDINGKTWTMGTVENVQFNCDMPQIPSSYEPKVDLPEGAFLGYYYGKTQYYSSDLTSAQPWKETDNDVIFLYAQFGTEYTVTLDFNGGSGGTSFVKTADDKYLKTAIAPSRTGYNFTGYYDSKTDQSHANQYYNSNMESVKKWDKKSDAMLYAGWEPIALNNITTSKNNDDDLLGIGSSEVMYINISGGSGWYYYEAKISSGSGVKDPTFETSSSSTSPTQVTKNKLTVTKDKDNGIGKIRVTVTDYYTGLYKIIDLDFSTSCFAEGTRILMANGSDKKIEDIKVGDIVMSWNFVTGQLEAMPVALYWYHGTSIHTVLNLEFSDKTALRIIGSHGLFDYDLNKYVYLTADNYKDYIGHSFVVYETVQGYTRITLTSAHVTSEEVGSYSLRTACNDNAFAEGLLTLTAEDFPGYLTYFEVGEGMKYDEEKMKADIEMYGLFTYEDWLNDWSDYITYEEFIAFNGQYFKVLIGKGILSYDDIFALIDGLRNGSDIQS